MDQAVSLVKELLEVPEGYSVLFLQGGASLQFLMAPMNLLTKTDTPPTSTQAHMGLESIQRSRRNRQRQMRGFHP